MSRPYRHILKEVRVAFPQPISDPIHDSYFVHSIMRALDQVDALKTRLPILGSVVSGDFDAARNAKLRTRTASVEAVTADLVSYLRGMTIFGHPRTRYQEPIFALKSYIQSPFVDNSDIEVVVAKVLEAREKVA